jgi:hypothetical protein
MQWKNVVGAVTLVAVTAVVTQQVVSQQEPPTEAEMMEMWMKLGQPNEQHELLGRGVGTWDYETSHWMTPDAPPSTSTGVTKIKSILDGRFTLMRVKGEMDMGMGPMPFEGLGIYGFNNATQKHEYAWVDNFGTLIMFAEGTADAQGNITYYSDMAAPDGSVIKFKSVQSYPSKDRGIFEMYTENPVDGSWMRTMEIASTRRK